MFYVVTLGGNIKLSPSDLNQIISEEKSIWNKKYSFRDMNLLDFKNKEYFYESRYNQHLFEKKIIEREYFEAQKDNIDYILFTTDPIVFYICRYIFKNEQISGKLIVYNKYNYQLEKYDYDEYIIDSDGRLEFWPPEKDDMGSPIDILLSELL